jgi:hypothetical protein
MLRSAAAFDWNTSELSIRAVIVLRGLVPLNIYTFLTSYMVLELWHLFLFTLLDLGYNQFITGLSSVGGITSALFMIPTLTTYPYTTYRLGGVSLVPNIERAKTFRVTSRTLRDCIFLAVDFVDISLWLIFLKSFNHELFELYSGIAEWPMAKGSHEALIHSERPKRGHLSSVSKKMTMMTMMTIKTRT